MMKSSLLLTLLIAATGIAHSAEDSVNVDTTHIKANKELPKVLYVIPWKDVESKKNLDEKIVLPELFGDLYEPVLPDQAKPGTDLGTR